MNGQHYAFRFFVEGDALSAQGLAAAAGMSVPWGRETIQTLKQQGHIERFGRDRPFLYRSVYAPVPTLGTVEHAKRYVPRSVFDLARE